jgi:dienelactone hydrolase
MAVDYCTLSESKSNNIEGQMHPYKLRSTVTPILLVTLLTGSTAAIAQVPAMPNPMALTPEQVATFERARRAQDAMPDAVGTGPYPAMYEVDPWLANHVVFRPANVQATGGRKLGVVVWGNGGCQADGVGARQHLAELASHGYLVIAPGKILSGPQAPPKPMTAETPAAPANPPARPASGLPPPATTAVDVRAGLDWALAENERPGSTYYHRIDPKLVAVSGHSCGGVQALRLGAADQRIRAVVVHNSGLFPDGQMTMTEMVMSKAALNTLHTPVIYIIGNSTDIAFNNANDDFSRITTVPVVLASLQPVGHGGTFGEPHGGEAAGAAVAWLEWQLRGDKQAARMFTGADCGLCTDASWKVQRKGIH